MASLCETQQTSKLHIKSQKINVNDIVLLYDGKVPRYFWRIGIIIEVLPSADSRIVRIPNANTILKRPIKKIFTVENTYHDTNQTQKSREQNLWLEATVIRELKRKYKC